MKRYLLVIFMVLGMFNIMEAQQSKLGIKAGYALITLKAEYLGNSDSAGESGFYAGFSEELMLNEKFGLQPELLYARAGKTSFLYLPIMAKYYVIPQLSLQAGPQANLLLDNAPNEKQLGLDIAFGAEYKVAPNLFLDARYGLEITNRMADSYGGYDIKASYNTLMVGAGYRF